MPRAVRRALREQVMAKVKMETKLPVAADTLWQSIGGFNALPSWHPAVATSDASGAGKGSTRTLGLAGGRSPQPPPACPGLCSGSRGSR